jgi:hypothetical protein
LNLANEFEGPDGPFEKKNARGLWHSVIYKWWIFLRLKINNYVFKKVKTVLDLQATRII